MERATWQRYAACRGEDPDLFFDGPYNDAKKVCARCPVRPECLAYALPDPAILGVWGGTCERQRRRMRKRARISGPLPA